MYMKETDVNPKENIRVRRLHRRREEAKETETADAEHLRWNRMIVTYKGTGKKEQAVTACSKHRCSNFPEEWYE